MGSIKKHRRKHQLSQYRLGEIVGVRQQTIHNWESGSTEPSISQAYRLAEALGCDISDLFPPPSKK